MSIVRTAERSEQQKVLGFKLQSSGSTFQPIAPQFIAAGTAVNGTGATSVSWPARHQIYDIGILVIEASGDDATVTPSGWQHLTGSPVTDIADATGSKLMVLWRRAASDAESAVTVPDPGDHLVAQIFAFRGVRRDIAPGQIYATDAKTTASTSATWPSITTLTAQNLILSVATRPTDASSSNSWSAFANANLTNVAEIGDILAAAGNGGGFGVFVGVSQTAQNIGNSTATITVSSTSAYMVAALEPSLALPV
jgi:hypothetical protein